MQTSPARGLNKRPPPRAASPWWIGALLFALAAIALVGPLTAQAPLASPRSSETPSTETPTTTPTTTPTATSTETNSPPASATATPTVTPIFSCCEHKIRIRGAPENIKIVSQPNKLEPNKITITLEFKLKLAWACKNRPSKECRVYYRVNTGHQKWQRRQGTDWDDIPWARVEETLTVDAPLEGPCDGLDTHKDTWKFKYQWVISNGRNVRNDNLHVHLRFPLLMDKKGTEYTLVLSVLGDRSVEHPTVTIKKVKVID